MPHRSLSGDFTGSVEAPPSYDHILSQQEFEQKAANVAEQTASEDWNTSGPADTGKKRRTNYDEFEDWDDAKFEAAAAAYRARLARQAGGAGSSSAPTSAASSSAYRSQSPARQPPSQQQWASPAVPAAPQRAHQLPPPSNINIPGQRSLPPRPGEPVYQPGPSSPPYLPALTSPSQFPDEKTAMPWMKSSMSDDDHGRASIESLPPFRPIASPTSEYGDSPFAQPQSAMSNPPPPPPQSAPAAMYNVLPPPPHINTSSIPQAPATAPILPTSYSASQPPIPPVSHRHSDIPSSTAAPRPPMAPQRRSDIPNANPQPPNFVGSRPWNLPQEKRPTTYGQTSSAASALYASAKTKTGMPLVRPDFGTLAYQTHTPSTTNEESHVQPSLYSSAVSSVLKQPTLPPVPKQTMSSGSQYSQPYQQQTHQQSYQQSYQTQGNLYGPYVSQPTQPPASTFYGQPTQNQGFYGQSQPVYSQYQPQVQQQQQQPVPPQGYPPTATQNSWAPAPDSWQQNYGQRY